MKKITFLIIPDNYTEPISFKLSIKALRIIIPLGVMLVIHIIMGGVFYWKYARTRAENIQLKIENLKLKEDNKKIYKIASDLSQLKQLEEKIKLALGAHIGVKGSSAETPEEIPVPGERYAPQAPSIPGLEVYKRPAALEKKLKHFKLNDSTYHNLNGGLPTLLPVEGVLTAEFKLPSFSSPEKHLGIDIAAPKGSVIRAAGDGWIVFANWTPELGNLVIIYHGSNTFTYYGHNLRILKPEKSFVRKGEPIALLGSSGITSTGPHLHFEIWKGGIPLNPKEYILSFQLQ